MQERSFSVFVFYGVLYYYADSSVPFGKYCPHYPRDFVVSCYFLYWLAYIEFALWCGVWYFHLLLLLVLVNVVGEALVTRPSLAGHNHRPSWRWSSGGRSRLLRLHKPAPTLPTMGSSKSRSLARLALDHCHCLPRMEFVALP